MELVQRAERFAAKAHSGQLRKYTGDPYFVHVAQVAEILREYALPEPVIAAGFLHDTIEDCSVTFEELREEFGENVARLVLEVTDVSRPQDGNRAKRKQIDLEHLVAASAHGQSIKFADVIDNTSTIVRYDPDFAKVYLPEKVQVIERLTRGHDQLRALALRTVSEAIVGLKAAPGAKSSPPR